MSGLWSWFSSSSSKKDSSSSSGQSTDSSKSVENDKAFSSLDPSLKDYFQSSTPSSPSPPPPTSELPVKEELQFDTPPLHSESSYGDRYASYWSTYKGYSGHANPTTGTLSQNLRDFYDGLKQHNINLSKAAEENCAIEQLELHDCFRNGSWAEMLTMCQSKNRRFNNCVQQQMEFLKALGYLSVAGRSAAEEERIQMHADKLYHMQLAQDEAAEKARKEGRDAEKAVEKVKEVQEKELKTPEWSQLRKS